MLQASLVFLIGTVASVIGAVTGVGGGILIKPLVDTFDILEANATTFLSGSTVLAMSIVSVWRNLRSDISIKKGCTVYLAIGSALGGIIGKYVFRIFIQGSIKSYSITIWQNAIILFLTACVFVYEIRKKEIKDFHIKSIFKTTCIGAALGIISSFLGIGGGPINIMVLSLCFSMKGKMIASNSIVIILFSQVSSLIYTLLTGVPYINPIWLIIMMSGGIIGGIIGNRIMQAISVRKSEYAFKVLLLFIMLLCAYNMLK